MKSVVLVPHLNGIEEPCETGLRQLEAAGIQVWRRRGCSAIDVARNRMASEAIQHSADSILFIDSDIGFYSTDAIRLLKRPEPVVCGVYPKKGFTKPASMFAEGTKEVAFGMKATRLYPLRFAAAGFLRIHVPVLREMIEKLTLPLCNTRWGKGNWPFFQPLVVDDEGGKHYLGEDWAFSHRLRQIGVTPMADTSIRLFHWGQFGYNFGDQCTLKL